MFLEIAITLCPFEAANNAVAFPIPLPAPVMIIFFFSSFIILNYSLG